MRRCGCLRWCDAQLQMPAPGRRYLPRSSATNRRSRLTLAVPLFVLRNAHA